MASPTTRRTKPSTMTLGDVTVVTEYAEDAAMDGGFTFHPGDDIGDDTVDHASFSSPQIDSPTQIAGSLSHLAFLNSLFLARLKLLYPNAPAITALTPSQTADAPALTAALPHISGSTPTFSLGTFTSQGAVPATSLSASCFAAALKAATLTDASPLLLYLLSTSHSPTPPNFSITTLQTYLLTLHMTATLFLPVSSFSPLIPDIALLLSLPPAEDAVTTLPVASVFAGLNKVLNGRPSTNGDFFLPSPTPAQHISWTKTFGDIVKKMYPKTHKLMEANGALSPSSLSPIFERFFVPLLPIQCVRRILDLFVLEGSKTLFRFGIACILFFKKRLKALRGGFWWDEVAKYAAEPGFDFDELLKVAFGAFGSNLRKRLAFPSRGYITRLNRVNEAFGAKYEQESEFFRFASVKETPAFELASTRKGGPSTRVRAEIAENMRAATRLGSSERVRFQLAQWVPPKLQGRKLELIYAGEVDGRSLTNLYTATRGAGPTITLVEVLSTGEVLGMFASHSWQVSSAVRGDGTCFVCRFGDGNVDDSVVYKWQPSFGSSDDESNESNGSTEQFMIATPIMMDMGSGALRLNEDMTIAFSGPSATFNNKVLVREKEGSSKEESFDVAGVEVYRFQSPW